MRPVFLVVLPALAGCASAQDVFEQGRGLAACDQVIPACPGLYAACVLDVDNFARTNFPGALRFMTTADPEVEIEVALYLHDQRDAGVSTQIYWNEPACTDVYSFDSGGRNLFEEASDHVLREKMKVHQGGDHLIEIITDMQCAASVEVDLIEPGG